MSVVNGKFIFCEGKEKSYDRALINRILDGISGVTIVPSGGKFNFSGFIDGYLDSQSNISHQILVIKTILFFEIEILTKNRPQILP